MGGTGGVEIQKSGAKSTKRPCPVKGGRWGSNPRPSAPQTDALTD